MNDIEREQYFKEQWIKLFAEITDTKEDLIGEILNTPDDWMYKAYMFKWNRRK